LIRRAAARTYDALWQAVGHVCELFSEDECYNFFVSGGHAPLSFRLRGVAMC
jgi:hypothetical protein